MSEKIYRIGEAAALLELKDYVLRFWETEFSQLVPVRTEKGQRLYSEENIALLRRIKYLLHEQGMTIEGARRVLAAPPKAAGQAQAPGAENLPPPSAQSRLSSEPELGYIEQRMEGPSGNGPQGFTSSGFSNEFCPLDPSVLEEVISGLEEVRRLLLPR